MSIEQPVALDLSSALKLGHHTPIVVVRRNDGVVAERLTILRYAGHYRADSVHAFSVKDIDGKFHVRSDRELGLTEDSDLEAFIATSPAAANPAA